MKTFENYIYDKSESEIQSKLNSIDEYKTEISTLDKLIDMIQKEIDKYNIDVDAVYKEYKDAIEDLKLGSSKGFVMNRHKIDGMEIHDIYLAMRMKKYQYKIQDAMTDKKQLLDKINQAYVDIKELEKRKESHSQLEMPGTERRPDYM